MKSWNERIVVNKVPNFYLEAVNLMDSYFQWKSQSRDESEQIPPWEEKHLIRHPENFTLPPSEIDALYQDVYHFLRECRKGAAAILNSCGELQPYFTIKPPEHTDDMSGFLKSALIMSDVQSTAELTRDEFAICCLFGLDEFTDRSQALDHEIAEEDEQAFLDGLIHPALDMKKIFDIVTGTSLSDTEQMLLLRFFQGIDTYYEGIRNTLLQLETLCRQNYGIVRNRYEEKIRLVETEEGRACYKEWIDRAKVRMEDFRSEDPIHMEVGIISYGELSLRFSSWHRLKLRMTAGLLFDELNRLEDKGRYRDQMTQLQLKAIADPTRYKIIRQLSIRPHYVQELADALDLTAATLSHHLTHLLQVLLVGVTVSGRKNYYSLNAEELTQLADTLRLMAQRSRTED